MTYNDDLAELVQMMDFLGDPWKRALRADTEEVWVESMGAYMNGEKDMVLSVKAVARYWHRDPVRVFADALNKAR